MWLRAPIGMARVRWLAKAAVLCSCLAAVTLVSITVHQNSEEELDVVLVRSEAVADPFVATPRGELREVALVRHEAIADGARDVSPFALTSVGRGRASHEAQAAERPAEPPLSLYQYDDKMFLAGAYADFRGAIPQLLVTAFGHRNYTRQLYCKHENKLYRASGRFVNYSNAKIARWRAVYFTCSVPGLRRSVVTVTLGERLDSASDVTLQIRGGSGGDNVLSLSSSPPAHSPLTPPLQRPPTSKQFLGVCVKSSYGVLDARRAVEWMELNEILGIDHVVLYNASIAAGAAAEATLRHYEARGRLTVVSDEVRQRLAAFETSLAPLLDRFDATYSTGNEPHPQSQLLSLQDCLHRYRDRFEYLLVIDLDEVLVPTAERSVPDLIRSLRRQNPTAGAFSFLAAEYLEEYGRSQGDNGIGPLLPHALAITRHTPPSYEQVKTVHSTADTRVINWHRRLQPEGGYVRVSSDAAWVHHYRKRCKGKACRSGVRWRDDGASRVGRFADELRSAVERAVAAIGAGLFV